MEKSRKKTITVIEIILILLTIIAVNRIFSLFVSTEFEKLVDNKNVIQAFYSEDARELKTMRTKYKIEYMKLQKNRVIAITDTSLPVVNFITFEQKKNTEVLSKGYLELLKKTHPYVLLRLSGLFIAFPLSFPDKSSSYIVFHKILP